MSESVLEHVYTCDCQRHCDDELHTVSRSKYYRHKKYRSVDSRASALTVQDGFKTVKGTRRTKARKVREHRHEVGTASSELPMAELETRY